MPTVITQYAINLDKHWLMLQQNLAVPAPELDLINTTYGTAPQCYHTGPFKLEKIAPSDAAYHCGFNISVNGVPFAQMLTDKTKKYGYNKHLRPLRLENEAFYVLDFAHLLSEFLTLFGLEIHNQGKIELFLDSQQCDFAKVLDYYDSRPDQYQRITRRNEKGLDFAGKRGNFTVYIDKDSKKVSAKMYNKSLELAAKPKPYISDWHIAQGFNPEKPIYRLEITIYPDALREHSYRKVPADRTGFSKASKETQITTYDIEIERLNDRAYLSQLFADFLPIDIRRKDASRATNCTRVPFIDFTIYPKESINTIVITRPTLNTLRVEKRRIKESLTDYYQTGEEAYLVVAKAIADRHQLTETLNELLEKLKPREAADVASNNNVLDKASKTLMND